MTGGPAASGRPSPAGLPPDARQRLDALGREHPEWRSWLALLEQALLEVRDPSWGLAAPEPGAGRAAAAPLLAGAVVVVDPSPAGRWLRRLLETAARGEGAGAASLAAAARADRLDPLAVLEAAVCQDEARLASLAAALGAEPGALQAAAHLAAMPLVQACGRHLAARIPHAWPRGYCPVCGAWPTLAELCGLENARRLRCARCGSEWGIAWLRCPYCGETGHEQLGSLVPERQGESRKVDVCAACRGYIKTVTTLRPAPPYGVALEDLATVDLDVAARARGYTRPERPAFPLGARLVEPAHG